MGETPFQNPANDEDSERAGEAPGERAQRLYEEQAGIRQDGTRHDGDAGQSGQARQYDPELGSPAAQPDPDEEPGTP